MNEERCANKGCGFLGGLFGDDNDMMLIIIVFILIFCCGCNR